MPEPPTKCVRISSDTDISEYSMRCNATDDEKYHLITNHFNPEPHFKFPKNVGGRSFQHSWMMKYPWLKYSKQNDGGYCLPCILFSRSASHNADPGVLVTNPLTNFRKALETLEKHNAKDYHKEALVKMDSFFKVMTGQQSSICVQLNDVAKEVIAKNRKRLQSIVETIILCGRQNIPL